MSIKEETICRFCLNAAETKFEVIDEAMREIFDFLLMRLNLEVTENPVICLNCAEIVKRSYYFKLVCIETEKNILSFAAGEKEVKFDIKDIYRERNAIINRNNICRFCMNQIESNFVSLDILTNCGMLSAFMPQMDLDIIKNSVVCTPCREIVECFYNFIQNCGRIEDQINIYCQNEGFNSMGQVMLSSITFNLCKNSVKQEPHTLPNTENVYSEVCNEFSKTEEAVDIKQDVTVLDNSRRKSSEIAIEGYGIETIENIMESDVMSSEEIRYKCETCPYETNYEPNIKMHVSIHTEGSKVNMYEEVAEAQMYKCPICTYKSKHKRYVSRHMLTHKDNSEVEMYKCPTCTYETRRKDHLKSHILIHKDASEVEMYKCVLCTYESRFKNSLRNHMFTHKDASEVEMYKCTECTYETKYRRNFLYHALTHKKSSEIEMHKCTLCTFETKRKDWLNVHMLTHRKTSEVETRKCTMCSYETKHKRTIKRHMLIHKSASEVQMYKCAKCAYATKHKQALRAHIETHKDPSEVQMFKCAMCPFETRGKYLLKTHFLTHKDSSEVKMYKCTMCKYQAKYKQSLKNHMLTHKAASEVEMYGCTMCTHKTKHKRSLARHMLTHKTDK